jgi:transposase
MPGSGKQSAQVQQQIIEFLEAGIDPTTIHRRLKVGRSSIYRMKRCLQQHGTPYAPPETNKKNGRPKVMTAEQEAVSFAEWRTLPFDIRTFFICTRNS